MEISSEIKYDGAHITTIELPERKAETSLYVTVQRPLTGRIEINWSRPPSEVEIANAALDTVKRITRDDIPDIATAKQFLVALAKAIEIAEILEADRD